MAAHGVSEINNCESINTGHTGSTGYNNNANSHQTSSDLTASSATLPDVCDNIDTVQASSVHHGAKMVPRSDLSLFNYFTSELTRGYAPEKDQKNFTEKRKRIYTFIKIPFELEQFIIYGFFQCVDAFLFIFTFLPLRICLALLKLLTHPCGFFMYGSRKILEPSQTCDILKGIIIVLSCLILNYLDISMMYHIIRGQAVLKLYVFYNIVELADKLFIGIGQDFLDSLFWSATEPRGRKREHIGVLGHLILAIFYVILHSILILVQATILNVAFNSHNKSLLIIMMSNNFVEIKINVFKRVDKKNLFQISCSDARERLQYIILLFIVFVRNMAEFSWNPEHISVILPDAVMILLAEVAVDWLKHAFISKFNEISKEVYRDFSLILAQEMVSSRQSHAFTDHSDLLSRRMGFTPLPLACILYQVCVRSFKVHGYLGFAVLVMVYLCLTSTKILNTMLLLGRANKLIYGNTAAQSSQTQPTASSAPPSPPPPPPPPPSPSSQAAAAAATASPSSAPVPQSQLPPPSSLSLSPSKYPKQTPEPLISVPTVIPPLKASGGGSGGGGVDLLLSSSSSLVACPLNPEDSPCSTSPVTPSTPPPTPTSPLISTSCPADFSPHTFTAALSAAAEASNRCGSFISSSSSRSSSRGWDEFPPSGAMPFASLKQPASTLLHEDEGSDDEEDDDDDADNDDSDDSDVGVNGSSSKAESNASPADVIWSQPSGIANVTLHHNAGDCNDATSSAFPATDAVRKRKSTSEGNTFHETATMTSPTMEYVRKMSRSTSTELGDISQEATISQITQDNQSQQYLSKERWL